MRERETKIVNPSEKEGFPICALPSPLSFLLWVVSELQLESLILFDQKQESLILDSNEK